MNNLAKRQDDLPGIPEEKPSLLEVIYRAAKDPEIDVDKMSKLVEMAERQEQRAAERAFDAAMGAAQQEMDPVRTNCANKSTSSKYASYGALDSAIRPIYARHGFSVSFKTGKSEVDRLLVIAVVAHKDGDRREYEIDMPADGKGAKGGDVMTKTHATGSAFSYGQRYLLKGIFNIVVAGDDDGNAAGNALIDDADLQNLQDVIGRTNSDPEKVCKYYKLGSLKEITKAQLPRIIEALNAQPRKGK